MEEELQLQEQDRAKLDGIVAEMEKNGEPEDNIRFVVSDFKKKYGQSEPAPVKKKEATESPSEPSVDTSDSVGSVPESGQPTSLQELPDQPVDPNIAGLYDQFKASGVASGAEIAEAKQKVKDQAEGNRGWWETAVAMAEGYVRTGVAVPFFKYDKEEDLIAAREQKNQVDFLSNLPEEKVAELKQHAGQKISDLDGANMNVLAENKILEEKGRSLVNELKALENRFKQVQDAGLQVDPLEAQDFQRKYQEVQDINVKYNKNIDILEENQEDIGEFYEEVNLLKKNFGGMDYYWDLTRLTSASLGAGAVKWLKEAGDQVAMTNPLAPGAIFSQIDEESLRRFTDEVAVQREELKPQMTVNDIDSMESFGAWLGEQVATQLPILTTLAMTGGTTGLGLVGAGAAGQKIVDLEKERELARENVVKIQKEIESGQYSLEEIEDMERELAKAEELSEGSDAEFFLAGTGVGALEGLSERVTFGIMSKGARAFKAALKGGKKVEVVKGFGRALGASGEEGGTEFGSQFGENLIDIMYLNNKDVHVFDGTVDALASGSALGFGMRISPSAVGMGLKAFAPIQVTRDIQDKTRKIADMMGELEVEAETLDNDTKNLIRRKSRQLSAEVKKEIKDAFGVISRMEPDNIQRLIDIDKQGKRIEEQAQTVEKSNMSREIKDELLEELKTKANQLREEKQQIIENAPKRKKGEQDSLVEKRTVEEGEGIVEEGADQGAPANVEGSPIDIPGRKIRLINPFTVAEPIAEIPVGPKIDAFVDKLNRKLVDRFFPIVQLQRAVENKMGKRVAESQDFRKAEVLMHGAAADKMNAFEAETRSLMTDLGKSEIKEKDGRGPLERFSDYLYARHAQERNAHIRRLPIREVEVLDEETGKPKKDEKGKIIKVPQGEVNEAGSGMTDKEAQDILNSYTEAELDAMERLAERVDEMLQETRDIMLEGGLITKLQHETLGKYYKHYVPLQGFESKDMEADFQTAFGLSMSIKGKETRRAGGRTSRADNVLANVVSMRNAAIVRAEKNKVLQKLYNLVKANPDTDTWQVFSQKRPDVSWKYNEATDKTGYYPENMQNRDKYVGVKIRGNQYYIKFANAQLAQTLNAASVEKTDLLTKTLGKFNRIMSSLLTTYNPEFMFSNFTRDLQTAIINLKAEKGIAGNTIQDKNLIHETMKNTFYSKKDGAAPAIRAIYRAERGRPGRGEIDRFYREFKEDGAKTDWFYAKDTEGLKKQMDKIVKFYEKGGSKNAAEQAWNATKNFLDDMNTAVENGVRLSAYMAARKAGVKRKDAAEMAKELTVNFNQKGELGSLANSWFLFFNASVQGTVRFARAMTTLKKYVGDDGKARYGLNAGQKIAAGISSGAMAMAFANMAISGEDEDGISYYDKIPDWEKERNMIFMNPFDPEGKDYFKFPLPYGYNVFHNVGTIAAEVTSGARGLGDGVGFMFDALIGAFSPVNVPDSKNFGTKLLKTASPTILKPIVEHVANETYFGSSIYNENFPVGAQVPDSWLGRPSTNSVLVQVAQFLNEATGGNEYESGAIDVNPDSMEHFLEFLVGGTGKFLNRSWKTGKWVVETAGDREVELNIRDIPFIRTFYGESTARYINQEVYYGRKEGVDQKIEMFKNNKEARENDPEMARAYKRLDNMQKRTDKRLKKVRRKMEDARNIADPIKRTQKEKEARDEQDSIISSFNKEYNKLIPESQEDY